MKPGAFWSPTQRNAVAVLAIAAAALLACKKSDPTPAASDAAATGSAASAAASAAPAAAAGPAAPDGWPDGLPVVDGYTNPMKVPPDVVILGYPTMTVPTLRTTFITRGGLAGWSVFSHRGDVMYMCKGTTALSVTIDSAPGHTQLQVSQSYAIDLPKSGCPAPK